MTEMKAKSRELPLPPVHALNRFAREEGGMVTVFAIFIVLMMLMVGGMGVDLMRNEMERTRVQNVADRAVLAAADLDQKLVPKEVVKDYFAKSGMADYLGPDDVTVAPGLNFRTVTVTTSSTTPTFYMRLFGIDSLPVPVKSQANEKVPNVEISLVLDISGSMRNNSRMDNLRPAAKKFINSVLKGDNAKTTSVSIIPYAGQTNPGPWMFNRLNGERLPAMALDEGVGGIDESLSHGILDPGDPGGSGTDPGVRYVYPNISSCLDVETAGFDNASLPAGADYDQTPNFMYWAIAAGVMDWGWCPQDQTQIRYFSSNAADLNTLIDTMRMHDGTGTHYAMKWAVALLDPSSSDIVEQLAHDDVKLAEKKFIGRPAAYSDEFTAKYVVLMTDGQITEQVRPDEPMHPDNPTKELKEDHAGSSHTHSSKSTNVANFFKQCNLAKNATPRGIVVYTIAFDAPGTPETQMKACATSESHFYAADGDDIGDVFEAIARSINHLRLSL